MNKFNPKNEVIFMLVFVLIVAGGTLGSLYKIRENGMKKRFKHIYSLYSRVLERTALQMLGDTKCYYSKTGQSDFSGCAEFYNKFINNMKSKRYCQNNGLAGNCVPKYESYTKDPKCYGLSEEMINKYDDIFMMANGSLIIIFNRNDGLRTPFFAVDVNGLKEPNKPGEDLFTMLIVKNNDGAYHFHPNITYCLPLENEGIENIEEIINK